MPIVILVGEAEEIAAGKGRQALTRTQAAARLGIAEKSIYRLIENMELTPYPERLFNSPLFLADEVEELRQKRLKTSF
jgi:predicted DNA-binding transcriptional regulator AlpA